MFHMLKQHLGRQTTSNMFQHLGRLKTTYGFMEPHFTALGRSLTGRSRNRSARATAAIFRVSESQTERAY